MRRLFFEYKLTLVRGNKLQLPPEKAMAEATATTKTPAKLQSINNLNDLRDKTSAIDSKFRFRVV